MRTGYAYMLERQLQATTKGPSNGRCKVNNPNTYTFAVFRWVAMIEWNVQWAMSAKLRVVNNYPVPPCVDNLLIYNQSKLIQISERNDIMKRILSCQECKSAENEPINLCSGLGNLNT